MKIRDILHEAAGNVTRKVMVFPGRFQPMMPHHAQVFAQLKSRFADHEVYLATSNKTGGDDHPFTREEKEMIAARLYGIEPDRILAVDQPYRHTSYLGYFDGDATQLTFALGAKDGDRLVPGQRNDQGLAVGKGGQPSHIQPIEAARLGVLPFNQRMYVYVAPTVTDDHGEAASASAFRAAFRGTQDPDRARAIFQQFMGKMDEPVFQLMSQRLRGTT